MTYTYILGHAGFAKELYEQFIVRNNSYNFGGFIVLKENKAILINENEGYSEFTYPKDANFIVGTGNKNWRSKFLTHFLDKYPATSEYFPNFYSEATYISKVSKIGIGNVFCPFSLVNGDAQIGDFNLFNIYSSISHDCRLGSYNILCPYTVILGNCLINDTNFFGSHVTITPRVKIGSNNTISAGECVFDDLQNKEFFQSGIIYQKT